MCYCPTPTLHLNLALTGDCAFQLSPKKPHPVWFISVLKSGDMGQCPEKSPSPCNTCVIPVSLYKSMSWFVTKTRTHTHSLTHSLTHSHTHTETRTRNELHSLSHTHTHSDKKVKCVYKVSYMILLICWLLSTVNVFNTETVILLIVQSCCNLFTDLNWSQTWANVHLMISDNTIVSFYCTTGIYCLSQWLWGVFTIKDNIFLLYKVAPCLKWTNSLFFFLSAH